MQILLSDTGKRFNRDWIFRRLSYQFAKGGTYAITGPNGSGKSTLLQIIAGAVSPSEGKIDYADNGSTIEPEVVYKHISLAAPYEETIEEFTLVELLDFHIKFKPFMTGLDRDKVIVLTSLEKSSGKQIRHYSSGMKQRVKLALAFFSDTPCLLLDEPCTNLDEDGIAMYLRFIEEFGKNRTIIVSSNDRQEYAFCEHVISMNEFKLKI